MIATAHADFDWTPARALTLTKARQRSRVIAVLRRGFVAAAGASFAAVFVFTALNAIEGGGFTAAAYPAEPLRMINPRFVGHSDRGPYQLSADLAERPRGEEEPIALTQPVYRTEAGALLAAPRGSYDAQAQTVVFEGDVLFADQNGNRFTTESMVVDLERGTVRGGGRVTGVAGAGAEPRLASAPEDGDKPGQ